MKENMMRNLAYACIQMNKLILIIPLFFITMCGEAPVTPPAHACSPRLDGKPTICPTTWPDKDIKLPRKELKGEVDIWNQNQLHQMHMMFLHNARQANIENNMTQPSDAINNALDSFWEQEHGSNGSTKSEELL